MPLVVPRFALLRRRKVVRTITLPNGERAKLTVDDWGNEHIERDEGIDAIAHPRTIRVRSR